MVMITQVACDRCHLPILVLPRASLSCRALSLFYVSFFMIERIKFPTPMLI